MPVWPMLLHRMALVSFRLFCKNLGNLQEFFGQMVYRPPWPKIARTPVNQTAQKIVHIFLLKQILESKISQKIEILILTILKRHSLR